jgi:hypothetical protein
MQTKIPSLFLIVVCRQHLSQIRLLLYNSGFSIFLKVVIQSTCPVVRCVDTIFLASMSTGLSEASHDFHDFNDKSSEITTQTIAIWLTNRHRI